MRRVSFLDRHFYRLLAAHTAVVLTLLGGVVSLMH
jgi:hypothetical protein